MDWLKKLFKEFFCVLEPTTPTGRRPFGMPYDPTKEQLNRIEEKLDNLSKTKGEG